MGGGNIDSRTTPPSIIGGPSSTETHLIPASHGHAFTAKPGSKFRIVDLHGQQVVDFVAWVRRRAPSGSNTRNNSDDVNAKANGRLPAERLDMAYTRYKLRGVTPTAGDCLYTSAGRPILKITRDDVKTHDMTFMPCNPSLYAEYGIHAPGEHRSCATNIAEVMKPYGLPSWVAVPSPLNLFQNTPNYTLKPLNCSRAGDCIEFEVLRGDDEYFEDGCGSSALDSETREKTTGKEGDVVEVICAMSCCPFELGGFNGGKITDVMLMKDL